MTNSNNLIDNSGRQFRNLVFLTILIIYLLILAGGIVRGTGSGMGCPDWPRCFGRWVPPTEVSQLPSNYQKIYGAKLRGEIEFNAVKTWIEYINRLLGVFSGFFVFATLVSSFQYLRKDKAIVWGSGIAFFLVGANGWLGSRVVATELAQYLITLHLLLAILVVFALLFVFVRTKTPQLIPSSPDHKIRDLSRLLSITMVLTLGQLLLGTTVRSALDEVISHLGYSQRENWVDSLGRQFLIHRSISLIILAFHLVVIFRLRKIVKAAWLFQLTAFLIVLVGIEIGTGAIMGYFAVPAAAQPLHLFIAVLIIGLQFAIWLSLNPNLLLQKETVTSSSLLNV